MCNMNGKISKKNSPAASSITNQSNVCFEIVVMGTPTPPTLRGTPYPPNLLKIICSTSKLFTCYKS